MRVKLLQSANIRHEAGEIVEVSPERAGFLFGCGAAEPIEERKETATNPPEAEIPEEKNILSDRKETATNPPKAETPEEKNILSDRKAKKPRKNA